MSGFDSVAARIAHGGWSTEGHTHDEVNGRCTSQSTSSVLGGGGFEGNFWWARQGRGRGSRGAFQLAIFAHVRHFADTPSLVHCNRLLNWKLFKQGPSGVSVAK